MRGIMVENAGADSTAPASGKRTLRLALAMRGGVSLAVWIGGAVAEIDLFRRACHRTSGGPTSLVADGENNQRRARATKYRELLESTKYDAVEVDILAGASAGGLNAVLFGLAQSCGTVMDEAVRRTWIESGGIWELLRDPGIGRVPSILKGDEQLFSVVRDALMMIARPAHPETKWKSLTHSGTEADRITVELAATLLDDPYNEERGNRASFSFTKTPGGLESHFTTIPDAKEAPTSEGWIAINRMALAARATSSFPGAFEPASIFSSPGCEDDVNRHHFGHRSARSGEPADDDDGLYVDMARAFLYARPSGKTESEPFDVVDGGIFDNIPVDRAIRAIRRAPTSQPSERWLIYLDPEPPTSRDPTTDTKRKPSAASWVPVIRGSMALKQRTESASDELRQLQSHNQAVLAGRGRLEALAALLDDLGPSAAAMARAEEIISTPSYTQCRVATDTARIATLLAEPWAELCQPPREAVDYAGLAPEKSLSLKDWVQKAYTDCEVNWELSQDFYAMLDWVRILIAWVHGLEKLVEGLALNSPQPALSGSLETYKGRLYRCLTVLVEARRLTTDLVLAEPLRDDPTAAWNYDLTKLPLRLQLGRNLQRNLTLPTELAQQLGRDVVNDECFYARLAVWSEARFETHRCLSALFDAGRFDAKLILGDPFGGGDRAESSRRFLRLLTSNCADARALREAAPRGEDYRICLARLETTADNAATEVSFADTLYRELNWLRVQLRQASKSVVTNPGNQHTEKWWQRWNESVFSHFYRPPLNGFSLDRLSRLFATAGVPDSSVIAFDEITGNERPEFDVRALENGARAKQLSAGVRHLPKEEPMRRVLAQPRKDMLTADGKLAGNVVSRFGGFFRARWRENDWQWGRLDAAAGIVKILNRSRPVQLPTDSPKLRRDIEELQASIVFESCESIEQQQPTVAERRGQTIVEKVGAEDLDALSAHYRFALASRIVPLVYRALMPSKDARWSIVGIATWLGQVIIRPLAVPLTLIADPLRMVLALAVILLAASFLGAARSQPEWQIAFLAIYLVLGILIAVRAWVAHTKWKDLTKQLTNVADGLQAGEWENILERADNTKRWYIGWSYLLALITCVWAVHHLNSVIHDLLAHRDQRVAMPLESLVATIVLILGLQHWLNKRAYRVNPEPTTVKTVIADFRRHWVRRVLAVLAVVAGLAVLRISNVIANYHAAVIANCDAIFVVQCDQQSAFGHRVGLPHWWWPSSLPGGSVLLSAGEVHEWWWDQPPTTLIVAGVAVALLILISLWGWTDNNWAIVCTLVGAGLAVLAQWLLDDRFAQNWRLWDLLPPLVWMGILGAVVAVLPVRRSKNGKPANYGETEIPVIREKITPL